MTRLAVHVEGTDPISQVGVATQLRGRPEVHVLDADRAADADVVVFVADVVSDAPVSAVRSMLNKAETPIVVVVSTVDDASLMRAIEVGVSALLRRTECTPERLTEAIVGAARGEATLAPDILGRLLNQIGRLQSDALAPLRIGPGGFNDREIEVLRLLADGRDTTEIAGELAYSERTIKNVIHDLTTRLNLRNRSHAVAYAVKAGVI